ncbi:MAG: Flp family type IVb pilin [Candidatus Binatales bacterium]
MDTPQLADRGAVAAAHRRLFGSLGDSPNLAWRVLMLSTSADSILLTDGSAEFAGVRKKKETARGFIMELVRKTYARIIARDGQAMTEYALILSAVAVVAFLVYQSLGNNIGTLLNNVISDL